MRLFIRFFCFCVLAALATGCAGAERRAREHPAVFQKLSTGDRRLVSHGRVRIDMDRNAVWIAWGEPARKLAGRPEGGKGRAADEVWIYERKLMIHAAIGTSDQWYPGNSLVAPGVRLFRSPGFGFGGSGSEGWLLYQPRVQYTDSYIRRAVFVNGRLADYRSWYGELPPLP